MSVPDCKTRWNDKNSVIKVLINCWEGKRINSNSRYSGRLNARVLVSGL